MRLFDLHCDTIYESLAKNTDISNSDFHITPEKSDYIDTYIQCFAICVPEEIRGSKATEMFLSAYRRLIEQCDKYKISVIKSFDDIKRINTNGGKGAVFTVENASPLAGKIENTSLFSDCAVKIVTLTWNGRNELGSGAMVSHSNGITPFGIEVIKDFENKGIVIDVSHASDRLMYDVFSHSVKPVIATHSNSRRIAAHRRNLTDEQFKTIASRGGVVGLNFHKFFLNNEADSASKYDILRHAEHFMSLGGENAVAIGADFDGCELPSDIRGIETMGEIYELFLRENYSEELVDKIFFGNAYNFFLNFDKQ